MAQKLDDSEIVSFKELLMANSIQVDAAVQLLIETIHPYGAQLILLHVDVGSI